MQFVMIDCYGVSQNWHDSTRKRVRPYLADDDSLDTVEWGEVERVEHKVLRRVNRKRAVQALFSDKAAELERVGLAQLPLERFLPRLLHQKLLQLRCAS